MAASSMSKSFFEFVKSIGEAKSKQEEDRIVEAELVKLKERMGGKSVAPSQMREYLIRMVYCEMLGHEAKFGHIHAVKSTRAVKLVDKRVGYLACALCLHKDHELMLLLVGGLQNDLASKNVLEVATALIVSCKLINSDTIPAVLPLVNKLLNHGEATVRKKAIMTVHRFWQLSAHSVADVSDKAKRMLCDKDPSVMGASLHLLNELFHSVDLMQFKDLVSSFVSILKQIIEHRLPKDYDYHRMPAPWTQVCLLQILATLGEADKVSSEGMYEVLHEVMRRADIGINVGYAIIYECVRTVTQIYPNQTLLAEAAKCTSRFIGSDNHNLKYLGINALASIVQVNPSAANEHQMVVIDCLEDKDETLRRKTLDLLYRMTTANNVTVVCNKLLASLKDSVDVFLRQELVEKITSLAEKFAPDTIWYIETMATVFELGGELVKEQTAHNFIKHMALGIEESAADEDEDGDGDVESSAIAQYVADFFLAMLEKPRLPELLLCIVAWVLGEYGHVATGRNPEEEDEDDDVEVAAEDLISTEEVLRKLWEAVDKKTESEARTWALSATCKLCRHLSPIPEIVKLVIKRYQQSHASDLQQLAHELEHLSQSRALLDAVFDCANVTDEVHVDSKLSFLNGFVANAVAGGAPAYELPSFEEDDEAAEFMIAPHTDVLMFAHREVDTESSLVTEKAISSIVTEAPVFAGSDSKDSYPKRGAASDRVHAADDSHSGFSFGGRRRGAAAGMWGDSGFKDDRGGGVDEDDSDDDGGRTIVDDAYSSVTVTAAVHSHDKDDSVSTPTSIPLTGDSPAISGKREDPDKVLTDNEKLMRALMGGDSATGGRKKMRRAISKRKVKKAKIRTKKSVAAKASMPSVSETVAIESKTDAGTGGDLLDIMGDLGVSGGGKEVDSTPVVAEVSGGGDLMDDLFGGTLSTAAVSGGAMDLLGDLTMAPPPAAASSMVDDLFGGGAAAVSSVPRGFAAIPDLKIKLAAFPRDSDLDKILAESPLAQLSYFKVYKQQQTSLCLFVSNLSSTTPLRNVQVAVNCSTTALAHMQLGIDVSNCVPRPKLVNAKTGSFATVAPNVAVCEMLTIAAQNPLAIQLPVDLQLSVCFECGGRMYELAASQLTIACRDLVRPLIISTDIFSQHWVKFPPAFEVRAAVTRSSCKSVDDYVLRIKQLQIHHIQTIGIECVAATRIQSATNASQFMPILVHAKVEPHSITLMVRSQNVAVSKALLLDLQKALM